MLKKIEEHKYEELRDYVLLLLNSFLLKQKDEDKIIIEILNEIKRKVEMYDRNVIIL